MCVYFTGKGDPAKYCGFSSEPLELGGAPCPMRFMIPKSLHKMAFDHIVSQVGHCVLLAVLLTLDITLLLDQ